MKSYLVKYMSETKFSRLEQIRVTAASPQDAIRDTMRKQKEMPVDEVNGKLILESNDLLEVLTSDPCRGPVMCLKLPGMDVEKCSSVIDYRSN